MTQRKPTAALEDAPVFHPLLFAACPLLGLYAYNVHHVAWGALVRPLVAVLLTAQALLFLFWIGLRNKHKAGIVTSFCLLALMWGWTALETVIAFAQLQVQAASPSMVYGALVGLIGVGTVAVYAANRHNRRRALVKTGAFLFAVLAGSLVVFLFLGRVFGLSASILIVAYICVIAAVVGWLAGLNRDFRPWTRTANWFAVILFGLYAALILINVPREGKTEPPPLDIALETPGLSPESLPDIYVLLLDGHARCDVLLTLYGYNNLPMLEALRALGVHVPPGAFANYAWNVQSATALLNMDYLDSFVPQEAPEGADAGPIVDLYHNNRFFEMLRANGYEIISYSPGVQALEPRAQVDRCLSPPRTLSEFEVVLLQSTVSNRVMQLVAYLQGREPGAWAQDFRRARIDYVFNTIGDVAAEVQDKPRVVFAHLSVPELPFLFERTGEWADPRIPRSIEERYLNQLHYTGKMMTRAIEDIQAQSVRPPVIVLASLHGPAFRGGIDPAEPTALAERFGVLLGTYYPGGDADISANPDPGPSLVNVLRDTLNTVLGIELPMLEDRAFLTPVDQPLESTPVTVPILDMDAIEDAEGS